MTAPNAPMSAEEMIDPLNAAVHCVREHPGGIRGDEMERAVAVAAMAEREAALIAADEEYDEAIRQRNNRFAADLYALDVRVAKARLRRAAALLACKGQDYER